MILLCLALLGGDHPGVQAILDRPPRKIVLPDVEYRVPGLSVHSHSPESQEEITRYAEEQRTKIQQALGLPVQEGTRVSIFHHINDNSAITVLKGEGRSGHLMWLDHPASEDWRPILRHELAHCIVADAVGEVPRWVQEGLACRFDDGHSLRANALKSLSSADIQWLTNSELLLSTGDVRAYAASEALVNHLWHKLGSQFWSRIKTYTPTPQDYKLGD